VDPQAAIDREMQYMGEQIFGAGLELIVGFDSRAFEGLNFQGGRKNNLESRDQTSFASTYLTSLLLSDFTLQGKSKTKLGSQNHVAQEFKGTP
ncbi:hypothetical protein Tco_0904446, partial [Tanacetum coccineum]